MKENSSLKNQLEDMKMTLNINKDLLFKYVSSNFKKADQSSLLSDFGKENVRLTSKIDEYYKEKQNLEKKIYKIQQDIEDKLVGEKDELEKANDEVFLLQNKISEKDSIIGMLKREIDKLINMQENIKKEIFVSEPSKINVELNNELNYTRDILGKISKLLNVEKIKNEKLENKILQLQDEVTILKKGMKNNIGGVKNVADSGKQEKQYESEHDTIDSDDDINGFSDTERSNMESPAMKFPDKVKMSVNKGHKKAHSLIPKLDFTKVQQKYQSENMKGKVNVVQMEKKCKSKRKQTRRRTVKAN